MSLNPPHTLVRRLGKPAMLLLLLCAQKPLKQRSLPEQSSSTEHPVMSSWREHSSLFLSSYPWQTVLPSLYAAHSAEQTPAKSWLVQCSSRTFVFSAAERSQASNTGHRYLSCA